MSKTKTVKKKKMSGHNGMSIFGHRPAGSETLDLFAPDRWCGSGQR
jgi:hypothetical protein